MFLETLIFWERRAAVSTYKIHCGIQSVCYVSGWCAQVTIRYPNGVYVWHINLYFICDSLFDWVVINRCQRRRNLRGALPRTHLSYHHIITLGGVLARKVWPADEKSVAANKNIVNVGRQKKSGMCEIKLLSADARNNISGRHPRRVTDITHDPPRNRHRKEMLLLIIIAVDDERYVMLV